MNRLTGKTVLVTGASAGIGEACARRFAAQGANLILVARRKDRLEKLAKESPVTVETFSVDVRDYPAVQDLAGHLDQSGTSIDILVNNAGLSRGFDKLHEGKLDDWNEMIDTNVKGLLHVSRAIIPLMVRHNQGHVINIGSIAGHIVYPSGNVYNATKFAVRALSDAMNIDLAGTAIRVSSIDPGMTETEFSEVRFHGDKERAAAVYKGFKPLSADDIADAVCYVANAPEHVNVADMIIMPTAQRSPYVVHRD